MNSSFEISEFGRINLKLNVLSKKLKIKRPYKHFLVESDENRIMMPIFYT